MQLMLSRIVVLDFESLDAQRLQSGSPHVSAQPAQASQQLDRGVLTSKLAPLTCGSGMTISFMEEEGEDGNINGELCTDLLGVAV